MQHQQTTLQQVIRLFPGAQCWAVDWSATTEADHIRQLFGTPVVPTPFTPVMDGAAVQEVIQRLNPAYIVARVSGGAR